MIEQIDKSNTKKEEVDLTNRRNLFVNLNYFKLNPEKVLGKPQLVSSRFGEATIYTGSLEDVKKIKYPNFVNADMLAPNVSVITTNVTSKNLTKAEIEKIQAALEKSEIELEARTRDTSNLDLITFDEIDELYNKGISDEEKKVFVWYMRKVLGRPMLGGWVKYYTDYSSTSIPLKWLNQGLVAWNHKDRRFEPMFIFLSGNLLNKLDELQVNKEEILSQTPKVTEEAFNKMVSLLKKDLKNYDQNWMRLTGENPEERLQILVTSAFAKSISISATRSGSMRYRSSKRAADQGKPDLKNGTNNDYDYKMSDFEQLELPWAFALWLRKNRGKALIKGGLTDNQIIDFYIKDKRRSKNDDPATFLKMKQKARQEGKRLFSEFLAKELKPSDQQIIEEVWNRKYNSERPIDLSKIPIGFSMARYYDGRATDIRIEKREAIAYHMMAGTGCLAYGVGLGKTWAAIFIIGQYIENGWSLRPMFALPNQVYKQFIRECEGLLPQYPINDFYNLSKDYVQKTKGDPYYIHQQTSERIPVDQMKFDKKGVLQSYKINGFDYKPESAIIQDTLKVAAKSITFFTYEGFLRLGIDFSGKQSLKNRLYSILEQHDFSASTKRMKKQMQATNEKIDELLGKSLKGSTTSLQLLGLDMLVIDEAHNAKKIFTAVKSRESNDLGQTKQSKSSYSITAGNPSKIGLTSFMISQYIQDQNKTGNILLLTATPFTNSPLEVYSMLALMSYKYLEKNNLSNLTTFFDEFTKINNELVVDTSLNAVYKEIFVGFANLPGLHQIIRKFFLYKDEAPNLKRPNKIVLPLRKKIIDGSLVLNLSDDEEVSSILPLSPVQSVMMKEVLDYAAGSIELMQQDGMVKGKPIYKCVEREEIVEDEKLDENEDEETIELIKKEVDKDKENIVSEKTLNSDDQLAVRLLRSVGFARSLALSPYLYKCSGLGEPTYKEYIETSNKLLYTMNCIESVKRHHEQKNEPISGQVIFMNRGVSYFPLIKEYLIKEIGFKQHEIGIIASDSAMKKMGLPEKRETQNRFLGRRENPATGNWEDIPDDHRIKILIGSQSILEGINLQRYSSTLYNLFIPWNPTDVTQLNGRIHRQGNLFDNVRIVVPLMEDSMDIFMFQKLEEKTSRINAVFEYDGNRKSLNTEEFNPKELKYQLIKDARLLAQIEAHEFKANIDDEMTDVKRLQVMLKEYIELKKSVDNDRQKYLNFIDGFRNVSEDVKDSRLITVINKFLKEGTDIKGQKISVYNMPTAPWGYKGFIREVAQRDRLYKDVITPRNLENKSDDQLRKEIEIVTDQLETLKEKKDKISSKEAIDERAKEINKMRDEKGYKSASLQQRVEEFEKLNYLLSDRKIINDPFENLPIQKAKFKKGKTFKLNGKKAVVDKVVARPGQPAMYWSNSSGTQYLVFENEVEEIQDDNSLDHQKLIDEIKAITSELEQYVK